MARKASGTLVWTKTKGWVARIQVVVDGVRIKQTLELGTDNRAVACRKMARIIVDLSKGAAPQATETKAPETVEAYAEDWFKNREARGIVATDYEKRYFERLWKPAIGKLALGAVTAAHIRAVLDDAATGKIRPKPRNERDEPERYSRQSIVHLRATIFRIFQSVARGARSREPRRARRGARVRARGREASRGAH